MTIHHLDPAVFDLQPWQSDGEIREKFVAVGEIIGIGVFRNHCDLIRALLRGPLANYPSNYAAALTYMQDHEIPFAFGNILNDHEIRFVPLCGDDIVADHNGYYAAIVVALTPITYCDGDKEQP
jgi:hypothetical protein